jgi:hypothetical protein
MKTTIVQNRIREIRGQKVILDADLAGLYDVETKAFNQAIKRNIIRFPRGFMFRLNKKEWNSLRSQIVTLEKGRGKHSKYLPYAFTEHGVTMAASVLKSRKAAKMNIAIVRAFIALRQFAIKYKELADQIKELKTTVGNHNEQLNQIYDTQGNLLEEKAAIKSREERERIGFRRSTNC